MAKTIRSSQQFQSSSSVIKHGKLAVNRDRSMKFTGIVTGANGKPESQMTSIEKMKFVNDGVSKKQLIHLKAATELDYDRLAKMLSVARATLINKKGSAKFAAGLSEKIVSLADIYSYGYEVFEDKTRFNQWIFKPNQALGGKAPYDILGNQFGREEVRNIIGRIDYGVYS